jgi:hypothetical protein
MGENRGPKRNKRLDLGSNPQKHRGWMAGSISKESRGLNTKNWADQQILLNGTGLRVDSNRVQGLFSKPTRPNRYPPIRTVGSRSGGFDSIWHSLILVAYFGSDT